MVGIDAETGKPIEEPAHIRQSIRIILTTPAGTRVMLRDFGVPFLQPDGSVAPETDANEAAAIALEAVNKYEPRIRDTTVRPILEGGALASLRVTYIENNSSSPGETEVRFAVTPRSP